MPRRCNDQPLDDEPPRKRSSSMLLNTGLDLKQGEVVSDILCNRWKLGKPVGVGGFGEIYLASDDLRREVKTDTHVVAKVEKHSNGPLFVEINCYLRIGKLEDIDEWKRVHDIQHLGMPHYVASGSHMHKGEKYRFLILPRFEKDLENILQTKKLFNLKTVSIISMQILDVLEYIHEHGYVHSDIKASNIMLGAQIPLQAQSSIISKPRNLRRPRLIRQVTTRRKQRVFTNRNLRPASSVTYIDDIPYLDDILNIIEEEEVPKIKLPEVTTVSKTQPDQVFLLDYGLASRFVTSNGEHKQFCTDQRRAHAGTLLFCSRDAHVGVPSRRSDLESLGYNIIYWLTGSLPWKDDLDQPEMVAKKKNRCFHDISNFLSYCFLAECPNFLMEFFNYLSKLQFEEKPDYDFCRELLKNAIRDYGYKEDSVLDFENLEGWGKKQKKLRRNGGRENKQAQPLPPRFSISPRPPLQSNIIFKRPQLRKKKKDKVEHDSMMNWSKILIDDPEEIIKQARERKNTDGSDSDSGTSLTAEELAEMNPTSAMIEVFNKYKENCGSSPQLRDDSPTETIEGYTPAMMSVYLRMKDRELTKEVVNYNNNIVDRVSSKSSSCRQRSSKRGRKRAESPSNRASNRVTKTLNAVTVKKDPIPSKKIRTVPTRIYSLRG